MVQLVQSIQCIVAFLADNLDLAYLFEFAKLDVKDGFWYLIINEDNAWNFCYVLLPKAGAATKNINAVEIVVPLSIQMGWCESPPYFCTSSKTSRGVMQNLLDTNKQLPVHKFEHYMVPQ
eukprot:2548640-Ditylum_brightwellii.AAC.1